MTDTSELSDEQVARLARLSERRSASASTQGSRTDVSSAKATTTRSSATRRRRHPAQGSRIAAAGLGATAMFGIVTLLGSNSPVSVSAPEATASVDTGGPSPAPTTPPVQVVVHWIPATVPNVAAVAPSDDPGLVESPTSEPAAGSDGPIVLTATPVVRTVTVQTPATPTLSQPSQARAAATAPSPAPGPAPAATTSGSS